VSHFIVDGLEVVDIGHEYTDRLAVAKNQTDRIRHLRGLNEIASPHLSSVEAEMLRDAGASWVIVGHSERRQRHGETDAIVAQKAKAARRAGLTAILCVGESQPERDAGRAVEVVSAQLASSIPPGLRPSDFVLAYEPVWAIGTGRTAKPAEIAQMHQALRSLLAARFGAYDPVRILYGGSVKPENAAEILAVPDVDGALIGGASLKAADFLAIAQAAPKR
jgi:triosephosphate isomerase